MANKVTKREYFNMVIGIVETADVQNKSDILGFLNHEIELLEKKSSRSKVTAKQTANMAILATIKEVLGEQDKPVTITELMTDGRLQNYKDGETTVLMTNQKLSSLVRKLVLTEEVVRTEEKKKAYFSLA